MCNCSKEPKKPKHSDEVLHLGVIHGSEPNRTRDQTRPDCTRADPTRTGRRHWTRPDHSPLLFGTSHLEFMFCGPDRTARDRTGLVQIGPDRTDYSSLYGELAFFVQTLAKPDLFDRIQIGIGNCHLSLRRTRHLSKT